MLACCLKEKMIDCLGGRNQNKRRMNDMYLKNQWAGCCWGTILIPDSGDRGWQISEFKPSLYYTVSSKTIISTILRKQREEGEGRDEWGGEEKKLKKNQYISVVPP